MKDGRRDRVVVTGLGIVSPVGIGVEAFWSALREGRSGIRPIQGMVTADLPARMAGNIPDFDPGDAISRKDLRRMDRVTQFAVAAAQMAFADAGLNEYRAAGELDPYQAGVCLGTGLGCMQSIEESHRDFLEGGPSRVSPFAAPMMIPNMPAGQVSIQLGLHGPSRCLATACATGGDAIGEGCELVRRGDATIVLAGGAEAPITRFVVSAFAACRVLSKRNDAPDQASRPFDRDRDGFVLGEGAGVIVLEEREHAIRRGARIYAEMLGYGATSDAFHMTSPHLTGEPMCQAICNALADAGVPPTAINYVNAHGTSTIVNDRIETAVLRQSFGKHADRMPVSSTKSMIGHLLGAAGSVEAIAAILSIRDGFVHPTINLDNPDPECDLDYVPNVGRATRVDVAMTNSLAFGGHNASLVLAHPQFAR